MKQKNRVLVLVITFITIFSFSLNAQYHRNKYYMDFWGAVGYSNLLQQKGVNDAVQLIKPIGGVGSLLGLGFEFHHKRFILSFGAEFDFKLVNYDFKPFTAQVGTIVDSHGKEIFFEDIKNLPADNPPSIQSGTGMIDTDGEAFAMQYNFKKYSEIYNIGYVNIPLLMGAKFRNGIYFLMGGKFGLNMFGNAKIVSKYNTVGLYPRYLEPFKDMRNHNYSDFESGNKNNVTFNYNIVASLEVGKMMFFNTRKTRWHYRIAGFVDYGIGSYFGMNLLPSNGKNVLTNVITNGAFMGVPGINVANSDATNVSIIYSNSSLTSTQAIDKKINPLLVGIKFTLLFDLGNKEPCNCLEDWDSKWKSKNRIK